MVCHECKIRKNEGFFLKYEKNLLNEKVEKDQLFVNTYKSDAYELACDWHNRKQML